MDNRLPMIHLPAYGRGSAVAGAWLLGDPEAEENMTFLLESKITRTY